VEMSRGVAVLGGVATPHLAALQAHAQVYPSVPGLKTFLTAFGVRFHILYVVFRVGTFGCAHRRILVSPQQPRTEFAIGPLQLFFKQDANRKRPDYQGKNGQPGTNGIEHDAYSPVRNSSTIP
jgi:hypothetical protein